MNMTITPFLAFPTRQKLTSETVQKPMVQERSPNHLVSQPIVNTQRAGNQFLSNFFEKTAKIGAQLLERLNQPKKNAETVARILASEKFPPLLDELKKATEQTVAWQQSHPNAINTLPPAPENGGAWLGSFKTGTIKRKQTLPRPFTNRTSRMAKKRQVFVT
jgi:hypothetical protein